MDFPGKITYTRGVCSDAGDEGIASCIDGDWRLVVRRDDRVLAPRRVA